MNAPNNTQDLIEIDEEGGFIFKYEMTAFAASAPPQGSFIFACLHHADNIHGFVVKANHERLREGGKAKYSPKKTSSYEELYKLYMQQLEDAKGKMHKKKAAGKKVVARDSEGSEVGSDVEGF
ncbi:hypothetical protein JB92DRAFT_2838179 [Gautieria morchelliformis]|nr:hypothetical protein JB92DRAFT_2838179 [Gautieria morchelliformis]